MIHELENPFVASIDAGVRAILQSRKLPRCRKMRFVRAELNKFEHRWKFSYYFDGVQDWDAAAGTMVDVDLPEIAPVSFYLPMEDGAKWLHKAADVVERHVRAAIGEGPFLTDSEKQLQSQLDDEYRRNGELRQQLCEWQDKHSEVWSELVRAKTDPNMQALHVTPDMDETNTVILIKSTVDPREAVALFDAIPNLRGVWCRTVEQLDEIRLLKVPPAFLHLVKDAETEFPSDAGS